MLSCATSDEAWQRGSDSICDHSCHSNSTSVPSVRGKYRPCDQTHGKSCIGAPPCSQSGALGDKMANLFAKGARRLLCAPLCSVTAPTAIGATGICQVRAALGPVAFLVAKATHHHASAERHLVAVSENWKY